MPKFRVSTAEHPAEAVDAMMSDLQRFSYLTRSSFEDDQESADRELNAARDHLGLGRNAQMDAIDDAALAQGDIVLVETTPEQWMNYYLDRGRLDRVRTPQGVELRNR